MHDTPITFDLEKVKLCRKLLAQDWEQIQLNLIFGSKLVANEYVDLIIKT